jgi:hypothetical protein
MSSATHIKLRAAHDAEAYAAQAHATQVEQARLARELTAQVSAPTPGQGSEVPRPDSVNPFEPPGLDEAPTPECRTSHQCFHHRSKVVSWTFETQENHERLGNDLLAQPAIPDFNTVLFSQETVSAFPSHQRRMPRP